MSVAMVVFVVMIVLGQSVVVTPAFSRQDLPSLSLLTRVCLVSDTNDF